jgi:hypothetical protein
LAAITDLQQRKTAYIKRLQQMRRVRRHTESNNLVLLTVLLEFEQVVALIAVNKEQLILSNSTSLCIRVKVFQLLQTKLIYYPTVLRDCNNLVVK